jgi:hypothetical protein
MTDEADSTGTRNGAAAARRQEITAPDPLAAVPAPSATVSEALFREIVEAAAEVGGDGRGAGGLKGYLRTIAEADRKAYFGVLARLVLGVAPTASPETVTRIERVIVQGPE